MTRWLFSILDMAVRSGVACISVFIRHAQFVALVCVTSLAYDGQAVAQLAASKSTQSTIEDRFYTNTVRSTSLDTPGAATLVPASDTIAVSGKIVGVDGRPAAGADVWAASLQTIPPVRELVKTNSDGNFQLKLLPKTDWSICAYQGSRSIDLTRDAPFNTESSHTSLFLNGQLKENCSVKVQVMDHKSGQSISEARMYLDDGRVLITDKSGYVDMSGLTRGVHQAVILARDYAVEEVSLYCDATIDNNNRIRMKRASNMFGTVTSVDGKPVANAWVARRTKARASLAGDGTYLLSDALGRFAGAYIPTSDVDDMRELLDYPHDILRAGAPGYLSKYVGAMNSTGNVSEPLEILLKANQSRDVLEKKNIKAPDGTNVFMQSFSPAETEEQPTDGMFRGYRTSRDQAIKVKQQSGMPDMFQKHFSDSRDQQTFQRRVVGLNGLPIEGVRVAPYDDDFFGGMGLFEDESPETQYTDKFGVVSLSRHGMGDLLLSHDSFASKVITVHELEENSNDVVMEPRRMLKANVVDDAGASIEEFEVTLLRIQPNSGSHMSVNGRLPREPVSLQCSNDRGEFYFSDDLTNQGRYRISINAKGMMRLIDEIDFSNLPVGATSEKTFKLERAKSLTLNLRAVKHSSNSDNAIGEATIAIFNDSDFVEGSINPFYGILKLAPDPQLIQEVKSPATVEINNPFGMLAIQAPGFARQFFEWESSAGQYDIALVPESVIAGTIESGSESDAKHSTHTLWIASIYDRYVIHEQIGERFEIPNLSRGWYRVLLTDGTLKQSSSDIFVESGERIDLRYKTDTQGNLTLEEKKSSGNVLGDDIQFTVNGKSRRYKTVDEYLVAIKEHVAMRSPEFAATLTKERLFEAIEDSIERFENPGGHLAQRPEFANVIKAHPVLKELANAEQWPEGVMVVYNDQNDQPYIALAVPTPNEQTIEQVLVVGF